MRTGKTIGGTLAPVSTQIGSLIEKGDLRRDALVADHVDPRRAEAPGVARARTAGDCERLLSLGAGQPHRGASKPVPRRMLKSSADFTPERTGLLPIHRECQQYVTRYSTVLVTASVDDDKPPRDGCSSRIDRSTSPRLSINAREFARGVEVP